MFLHLVVAGFQVFYLDLRFLSSQIFLITVGHGLVLFIFSVLRFIQVLRFARFAATGHVVCWFDHLIALYTLKLPYLSVIKRLKLIIIIKLYHIVYKQVR